MAELDDLARKTQLLEQIKKIELEIEQVKKDTSLTEQEILDYVESESKAMAKLGRQIKEINLVRYKSLATEEKSLGSLNSLYKNLVNLDRIRIQDQFQTNSLTKIQEEAIQKMAEINRDIAELGRDDVIQKAALLEEYSLQKELLSDIAEENKHIVENLQQQNDLASNLSQLTKKQKDFAQKHLDVLDGIKDTIGGILETASLLTSTTGGVVGGIMLGASAGMKQLLNTSRELGGDMFSMATVKATLFNKVLDNSIETTRALADEFGGLNETTTRFQLNAAAIGKNYNLAGNDTASLLKNLTLANGGSQELAMNTLQGAENLARAEGIPLDSFMQDVAGASNRFALFSKDGGKNILKSVAAAKKLGIEFSALNDMTDSLLDFETSLTQEMEFNAMTGKNINLNTARALAYQGDQVGAAKELVNQMGGAAAWAKMEYYDKKQAAALLGMQADDLQKLLDGEEKLNELGDVKNAQYDETEQLAKATSETSLNWLSTLGSIAIVSGQIGGSFGQTAGMLKDMVVNSASFLKNLVTAPVDTVKNAFGGIKDWIKGVPKVEAPVEDITKTTTENLTKTAKDGIGPKVTDSLDDVGSAEMKTDKSLGDKLKDLSGGLESMGTRKVLYGALNLIPTGLGFLFLTPGIPGMWGVSKFGQKAGEGLVELGKGLAEMGTGKVTIGSLNLGVAGLGFLLLTPGIVGMWGVATLGTAVGVGLMDMADGLTEMGTGKVSLGSLNLMLAGLGFAVLTAGVIGMAMVAALGIPTGIGLKALGEGLNSLGSNFGNVLKGALAIGILGLSLIPFAYGLSFMAGVGIGTIGVLVASLLTMGIAAVVLGNLITQVLLGALAISLLGLALIPFSYGLNAMAGVGMETIGVIAVGLLALGISAALLGVMFPLIIAGTLAIIALGASLAVFGVGVMVASIGLEKLVNTLSSISPILSQLKDTLGELLTFGAGLLVFAVSLGVLAYALVGLGIASLIAAPGIMVLSVLSMALGTGLNMVASAINNLSSSFSNIATTLSSIKESISGLITMGLQIAGLSVALGMLGLALIGLGVSSLIAAPGIMVLSGVAGILGNSLTIIATAANNLLTSFYSMIPMITQVSTSLSGLISLVPGIYLLSLGLGVLATALFGLGVSSMFMGGAIIMLTALSFILSKMANSITLVSEGISNIVSSVQTLVSTVVSNLSPLTGMVDSITSLAGAIIHLGSALAFLSVAGVGGLAVLAGISALAEPISMIASSFGIGGTSQETGALERDSLSEYETNMLQKMDRLIEAVSKNRDVYIDKEKVTDIIMTQSERKTVNLFGVGVA